MIMSAVTIYCAWHGMSYNALNVTGTRDTEGLSAAAEGLPSQGRARVSTCWCPEEKSAWPRPTRLLKAWGSTQLWSSSDADAAALRAVPAPDTWPAASFEAMACGCRSVSIGAALKGGGAPVRPLVRATPTFAICTETKILWNPQFIETVGAIPGASSTLPTRNTTSAMVFHSIQQQRIQCLMRWVTRWV